MKKILTIMVLALALCLVCGAALADEYAGSFTLFKADGVTVIDTIGTPLIFQNAKLEYVSLNPYTLTPTLDAVKANKEQHAEFQRVAVNGFDTISGKIYPEVYIYVRVNEDHDWKNDNTDERNKAATCSAKGVQVKKCSVCGITKTEDTAVLAHSYVRTNTSTCLAEGKYVYRCSKCGEDLMKDGKVVEEPLSGADLPYNKDKYHKYEMVIEKPSCSTKSTTVENGKVYFKCSVCKDVKKAWTAADNNAVTEAFGYAPGPDADGKAPVYVWMYKNYTKNDNFDGHDWSDWYDHEDATCYHAEQHKRRCWVCGLTYNLPVEGGAKILDPVWILDPSVTCKTTMANAKLICALCNSKAPAHPAYVSNEKKTDPNNNGRISFKFTVAGEDIYRFVPHAGKLDKTVYVSPANVEYAKLADVPAADKKDGTFCTAYKTRSKYKCSVCNATYDVDVKNDHTWSAWEKTNDNSPVDKWTRKCSICNKVETTTVNPGEPPCKEHTWTADEGQTIVCGKNANIKQTCSVCGAKQTAEWERKDEWKVIGTVKEATCTEKGVAIAVCIYEGCKNVDYPEIEATGHKPVEVAEVPATCKTTGTKAGYKCENCGKFLDENKADANVIEALEVIPVDETAHVKGELEAEVPATCTAEGKKLYTCTVCGKTITEKIEKLAHTWDAGVITKEATMEAKGEKTFTCTVCGETKKEEVEWVPAEPAKYEVKDAEYDGKAVSGKVEHVKETKELAAAYARVTFFYADGTFAVMVVPVEDGEFYAGATTATVHVAVQIVDNAKQITPPAESEIYGSAPAKMK